MVRLGGNLMKLRPFTKENIDKVMGDLSWTTRREIEIFGVTVEDLKERVTDMIEKPFTSAFYDDEGVCYILCGLENIGEKTYRTHFVEREGGLDKIGKEITRLFKRMTDNLVEYEGFSFEILSAFGEGTKAFKWFLAMGFRYSGVENGKFNKYVKNGE